MNKIVIYPGRFQPMLSHHAEVFKQLQAQFPDAEVYIGTSDKVELPKSPFNFKEKQQIAAAHGIPADRVLAVTRTYHQEDYAKYFDPATTLIIFAVGEKDLDRFPFNNINPETGLDMTVRGEAKPKYFQKINTLKADPKPMSERGYITLAPTIKIGNEIASASAFRDALKAAPDVQSAKQIYTKQFGTYNDNVFNLIYNKIARADMSEQINILRKLAGLPVQEAAPVEFSSVNAKAAKFLPPSASSSKMSIANRFPKGADVNDLAVKQEQFIQALLRSPEALLAEISERLDPKDNNSLAVDQKVSDIVQLMNQKDIGVGNLPKDLKQFVLDLTVNAVKNMDLTAGDNSPAYDDSDGEDEFKKENVDLNNIRGDYGVNEDEVEEAMAPEQKQKLDDLIDAYRDATDPSGYSEEDPYEIVQQIRSEFGDKIADQVDSGGYIMHFPRPGHDHGYDPLANKSSPRVTKSGKINRQDAEFMKRELKQQQGYRNRTTEGFSSEADQVLAQVGSGELDAYDVMSNPKGPAQAQAAEIIQSMYNDVSIDNGLHPDDDFEKILDIVADQLAADYGESDADTREAVDSTSTNALEAAMFELRKLAGLR
jgi:hypothetical protein